MDFFKFIIDKKLSLLFISIIFNFILISITGFLIWNIYSESDTNIVNENIISKSETIEDEKIYVDIKGEVKKPNVYEVTNDTIINDVINMAGGFTKKAYKNNINLSKKVSNEMVIYVYSTTEYKKLNEPIKEIEIKECICPEYEISDCISNGNSEIIVDNSNNSENTITESNSNSNNNIVEENKNESKKLININSANISELMTLSGIGEAKAKAIIEYRNTTKFKTIEDIKNVSGIGDAAFEKIKNDITV